jgi:Caspase domain
MWLQVGVAIILTVLGASMTAAQERSAPRDLELETRDLNFQTLDLILPVEDMEGQPKQTAPVAAKPPAAPPAKSPDAPPLAASAPKPPTGVPPVAMAAPKSPTNAAPALSAPQAPVTPLGRRVALVIGNANYNTASKLLNPRNDAGDVAAAFRSAGFTEVVERYDIGVQDLQKALRALEDRATGADWAVVYYAGHGIEVDGRNYLIPVDAAASCSWSSSMRAATIRLCDAWRRVAAPHAPSAHEVSPPSSRRIPTRSSPTPRGTAKWHWMALARTVPTPRRS